jgi:hypothetical protein
VEAILGAFASAVVVVAGGPVAQAATLFTPPLVGRNFACVSTNVSRETRQVTIELLDSVVEVVEQNSDNTSMLSPLKANTIFFSGFVRPDWVVCRITVQGSKKPVRGTLCITDDNRVCTVAVPAQ